MQAAFQQQWVRRTRLSGGKLTVALPHGGERFIDPAENRHHCIADCFDDSAVMRTDGAGQDGEVIPHQGVGGAVTQTTIEGGRSTQIGEQNHLRTNGDLFVGRYDLASEEFAELLPVRGAGRSQDVVAPLRLLPA